MGTKLRKTEAQRLKRKIEAQNASQTAEALNEMLQRTQGRLSSLHHDVGNAVDNSLVSMFMTLNPGQPKDWRKINALLLNVRNHRVIWDILLPLMHWYPVCSVKPAEEDLPEILKKRPSFAWLSLLNQYEYLPERHIKFDAHIGIVRPGLEEGEEPFEEIGAICFTPSLMFFSETPPQGSKCLSTLHTHEMNFGPYMSREASPDLFWVTGRSGVSESEGFEGLDFREIADTLDIRKLVDGMRKDMDAAAKEEQEKIMAAIEKERTAAPDQEAIPMPDVAEMFPGEEKAIGDLSSVKPSATIKHPTGARIFGGQG